MKIAIAAEGPDITARVGYKMGIARYILIVDPESGKYEAFPNPGATGQQGAGIQAVLLAIGKGAGIIITGTASPAITAQLKANGIQLVTGAQGTVDEVLEQYRNGELNLEKPSSEAVHTAKAVFDRSILVPAIRSAVKQFLKILPVIVGVVLLMGLFTSFVSREFLDSVFTGNAALDTLWGACFGSILAGNAVNSYIIGGELLGHGVSLYAVTALIITWVTVGLVQLPAEMSALGRKYAILRTAFSFVISIPIALLTVVIVKFAGG